MSSLSLSDASKISQKSVPTVRRWIKSDFIKAAKDSKGNWKIDQDELLLFLSKGTSPKQPTSDHSASIDSQGWLHEALKREQMINDQLRRQLDEKNSEVFKLMQEMKSILQQQNEGLLSRWLRK